MYGNMGRFCVRWLARHTSRDHDGRHRLAILIYHRVLAMSDALRTYDVDAEAFRAQMNWVKSAFTVLPLREAMGRLRDGTLPPSSAAITFDDGYRDNVTVALPILKTLGLPATFFIASGYLDGGIMWNDAVIEHVRSLPDGEIDLTRYGLGVRRLGGATTRFTTAMALLKALKHRPFEQRQSDVEVLTDGTRLPCDLMMTSEQVSALHCSGMEVGGHTRLHPILARLPDTEAVSEISLGKADLERIIGAPLHLFAYPNGKPGSDYLPQHVAMVRDAGFEGAVSTQPGVATFDTNLYELPRFTPWDRVPWRYGFRLALSYRHSVGAEAALPAGP